jgi:hypothetical protein
MDDDKIKALAAQLDAWLTTKPRGDPLRPEWVEECVYSAHAGMLPDDWKFKFVAEAASGLASEGEEWEPEADIYNGELLRWLSSNLTRSAYCDQAGEDGLVGSNMMECIGFGQYVEMCEVRDAIVAYFEENEDELMPDEEEEDDDEAEADETDA